MHRAKVRKYEKLDIPDSKERLDGVPRNRLEYEQEEEENPRICSYTVGFNAPDPLLKVPKCENFIARIFLFLHHKASMGRRL